MDDMANELARTMLEEGRELVSRREIGTQFTLDVPSGHPSVTRSNLMFSLMILGQLYDLRVESYEGDTFAFTKLGMTNSQKTDTLTPERTTLPWMLGA